MGSIWLYFITLAIMLIVSFVKKWNPLGKIIISIYSVLAFIGLFVPDRGTLLYVSKLDESLVTYPIVLFLLFSYTLFFSPFLHKNENFSIKCLNYKINRNYKIFTYFYLFCGLIYVVVYAKYVLGLISGGDWASNRLLMLGDTVVYPYSNIVEKLSILFVNYFQLLALIVGFLLLRDKKHRKMGIGLLVVICACEFCNDIYVSSRGMLVQFAILLLALYFFFYPDIEKNNKRFINIMMVLLLVSFGPYLAAVTISRFSDQVVNSLVYYFGQPPYVFSLEVNSLTAPMFGRFAFGPLLGDPKFLDAYSNWDHMFYTFVGWLYADWGFIGTIIIGIVASLSFKRLIRKRKLIMCDIFILLAYYRVLIQGAFTIGRTRCYELIITVLIYILLKYFVDKFVLVFGFEDKRRVLSSNGKW